MELALAVIGGFVVLVIIGVCIGILFGSVIIDGGKMGADDEILESVKEIKERVVKATAKKGKK